MIFDPIKAIDGIIKFTKEYVPEGVNVVIGMSGGKDSTITAALLEKALGKDRIIGVAMPDKGQGINDADKICDYLGIKYVCIPIGETVKALTRDTSIGINKTLSVQAVQNIPPRVRMTTLYAVAQCYNAFVVNTCNLCEDYVGYATVNGDAAGSFSLLADLTVDEILRIGHTLGLPDEWVNKVPDDGLPHSSPDEKKLGFTYHQLSDYIRRISIPSAKIVERIESLHYKNMFKLKPMPKYESGFVVGII